MARVLDNSTYLDLTSYRTTTATTVKAAYQLSGEPEPSSTTLNVALILPRANDPTALLQSDWGTRQKALQQLEDNGTLWSTYGANPADYADALEALAELGIPVLGDANGTGGYVTSQESRTIWVKLTPQHFTELFGQTLYGAGPFLQYWHDNLSLPDAIRATGVWFDSPPIWGTYPAASDLSGGHVADLEQGPQSIGNALAPTNPSLVFSGDMAQWFYNFPLTDRGVATATVGLVEPGIGDALPHGARHTFQQGLDSFRHLAGLGAGSYYSVANSPLSYEQGNGTERSLDVGVVTSASPGSTIGLYGGSGFGNHATANAFTAYQAAFWDQVNSPPVVSSSFGIFQQSSPHSPFASAVHELFVDAALRNITTFIANNDWGSSYNFPTGIAHQNVNLSSPYAVLVGGTSITTMAAAPNDVSVHNMPSPGESLYGLAMAGDLSMLWLLIEGGLMKLPAGVSGSQDARTALLESVWNVYALQGEQLNPGLDLADGGASDGGVDTAQPTPWYQTAFGLTPTSANPGPWGGTGRGAPDVASNAGGNMNYYGPPPNMAPGSLADVWNYWGTSAATPLWASLAAQIDTIFQDQGLPNLGYANDLLYTAAAIAPASFNDIVFGNNVSSYIAGGPIDSGGTMITLTGFGYSAAPGYDLTTGLGTPNGTLLARALTTIGHSQMSGTSPDMLDANGQGGWTSGADQSLLFQSMSAGGAAIDVSAGSDSFDFFSGISGSFAWTNRFAQQSLQADFDPDLVRLYDRQTQGWLAQDAVATGESLSVSVDASSASALQGTLTSDFGFADFVAGDGAVRVARAVAVAETAGGGDDNIAIVRLRQNGEDSLSLSFYRVDDLVGTIDGLNPGEAGYAAAAAARAYQVTTAGTSIQGPGYGNYAQAALVDVDANDLIAMKLTNTTSGHTYWGFAQANETVAGQHVGHLWNYGLNTWGFEDLHGGGDRDFNDLVVQLDFTSASGHGWLV